MNAVRTKVAKMCKFSNRVIALVIELLILSFLFVSYLFVFPVVQQNLPFQSNLKEISLIVFEGTLKPTLNVLKKSKFNKIHAYYLDSISISDTSFFCSNNFLPGNLTVDSISDINTTFTLFSNNEHFKIPKFIPYIQDHDKLAGYIFSRCYPDEYALYIPETIHGVLLKTQTLKRFLKFSQDTLQSQYTIDKAFHIFMDFHSLRLLMMPCGNSAVALPSWEHIIAIDSEDPLPLQAWSTPNKIPETWKIVDIYSRKIGPLTNTTYD